MAKQKDQENFLNDAGEFETLSGYSLPVKPVKLQVIKAITMKMGPIDMFSEGAGEILNELEPAQQAAVTTAWVDLCHYCLGQGVEFNVPGDAQDELEPIGLWDKSPMIQKSNYLQVYILEDETEIGHLVGTVIHVTSQAEQKKTSRANQPSRKKKKK